MGGSSSKSTTNNTTNQTFINKTTVDILNKNTNEAVANALIKNGATCSVVNEINQNMDFHGCKVGGDINVDGLKQTAVITVDFSCINAFKAEQEMAQSLLSELVTDLQAKMDAKSLNDMNTKAENTAKTSGILSGSSSTDTNVNNTYNLKVVNDTNQHIQNVIANSVQSNFEVESIQECINKAAVNQKMDFSNCEAGGSLNVKNLEQNASISSVVKCVNNSGTVQKIMNDAGNVMNVVVETETKGEAANYMKNVVTGVAESIGIGGGCPSCPCPGCGDGFGASLWLYALCILIICCCVCCVMCGPSIASASMMSGGSSK
ncbi:hypothetical protein YASMINEVIRUS_994 [Yasminevirus sp. GU-2018]|uniref:Uncharacterized protein n=1 Tax=Yasminevirus sp. GU-2018 TaxID=2420051 RepID=A0A5K0UAA7_9VIRU|nr:hypothetical protein YASMINEVIRUS_994 [Yasminevirus sp. GU-2018]